MIEFQAKFTTSEHRYFLVVRGLLGLFLLKHFLLLYPYSSFLYTPGGAFPVPPLEFNFPSILAISDSEIMVHVLMMVGMVGAVMLALGVFPRAFAILLWYLFTSLSQRAGIVTPPSDGYIGWLLIFCAVVPGGSGSILHFNRPREWAIPPIYIVVLWIVLCLSYSASGIDKWGSPSWRSGEALMLALSGPIGRTWAASFIASVQPTTVLHLMSWASLGLEAFYVFFCLFTITRYSAWWAMLMMHLGILCTLNLTDVSLAMILFQLFAGIAFCPTNADPKPAASQLANLSAA